MTLPICSSQPLLIHGDCLKIMPTLPAQSVQMVFADLPYRSKRYQGTKCSWDIKVDLPAFWAALSPLICAQTAVLMTATQPFTNDLINSNVKIFRHCYVWIKHRAGNFMHAKRMPMRLHEDVCVFYRKQPCYNAQKIPREKPLKKSASNNRINSLSSDVYKFDPQFSRIYTDQYTTSVLTFKHCVDRGLHPTQKPVALLEHFIRTYTNPGDTVLDPVAGSGTTAIAAMRTRRKAICIEKDATYFAAMSKRVTDERTRMQQEQMAL